MPETQLRRGDIVDVKPPAEILATLDERGDLDGLPFMEEMATYCGLRFRVDRRADKICDTVAFSGSRRLPNAILLDDLRCDGSGHDGCEADCRLFWKEEWLTRVEPDAPPPPPFSERDRDVLIEHVKRHARTLMGPGGRGEVCYRCQGTEVPKYSHHLRTFDPRPYFRELTSGNVSVGCFLRVMTRAAVEEPRRKLGLLPELALTGPRKKGDPVETLDLQPGDVVRVRSREEIRATLDERGMNRGLRFDREMLPFCGRVFRVRRRVTRFIDEVKARMVVLKSDAVTLDGAVCDGELNARWFCPRGIYSFWRECWVERVDDTLTTAAE